MQLCSYTKMNKKQNIEAVNRNLQLVRISNRNKNCLRWSSNETKEHILKKLELCMDLKKKKMDFITEAIFHNNSRADILSLQDGVIFELLKSEKIEDAKKKLEYYPSELNVIFVKI